MKFRSILHGTLSWISCAAAFALLSTPALASEPIFGRWLTDDRAAIIATFLCGGKLCGKIERILDPAAPERDINNPEERLRTKPLVGTYVLTGFVRTVSGWKEGRAYDPKTGSIYPSSVELLGNGNLKVTGCVLFVCRSRYWTRAN